jgi:hypothetical protein
MESGKRPDSAMSLVMPVAVAGAGNTRTNTNTVPRESFDNIYLDLSKEPGKCRLAESGLGWKPSGGSTFTRQGGAGDGAMEQSRKGI